QNKLDSTGRKKAYECDITYGTNNEFGFDYLRDNMALRMEDKVQRSHHYAIVDEVDSILIDEARTPLIISGPAEKSTELYGKIDKLVPLLKGRETVEEREEEDKDTDYVWNPKDQTVALTEKGVKGVEKRLRAERLLESENLYQDGLDLATHVNQALRAHKLFEKDRDYLVKDGEVVIIDEFTGRLMPGRRWSDGLHQAVEAKEGVMIRNENQTLATITLQNYFRMYDKLAGMTGTAATESDEFLKIYNLEVVSIPTHKPTIRENVPDRIYQTEKTKFEAVIKEVEKLHQEGSPVLVGTRSVEKSEALSRSLREKGVPHTVLNAKYHEKEAQIVAQAGEKRAVTIATNMAGRGTDIKLGEGVEDLGGLFVIGTERHESRRIDNQLRGRSGRQGAPGTSQLYVSLEDELMRLFGSERIARIMQRLKIPEDQPIEHPWVTKALERAQEQVERRNFDIRKHLLEYDDVMNKQREVIYKERDKVLRGENLKEDILEMMENVIDALLSEYADEKIRPEDWDRRNLLAKVKYHFSTEIPYSSLSEVYDRKELQQIILEAAKKSYEEKDKSRGEALIRGRERMAFLHTMDSGWKDHLYTMDILKEGIGLRGYGQHDPLIEYKREAYSMFEDLIQRIRQGVVEFIFKVEVSRQPVFERILVGSPETPEPVLIASDRQTGEVHSPQPRSPYQRRTKKVGRNEPCPCGSGKKYKYCCGR
ncbi:preprotein translocase subunit SecA, partial [Candidatus Aerophobetes bacterium]